MIEWIKITPETILPKEHVLLMSYKYCPYETRYAGTYEILSFSFQDSDGEQTWHTACGDSINGDEKTFKDEIIDRYSHYSVINPPKE